MSALFSLVAQIVAGLFGKLLEALRLKRQDGERDEATRDAATSKAEAETTDVIAEIADERSQVATGGGPAAIAQRLRERIRSEGGAGSDP